MITRATLFCLTIFLTLPCLSSFAGARRFTYSYEATTAAPGVFELENWVTWQSHKEEDSRFNEVDFRHEIEFGLTNHLQMGVYLADWNYQTGRSVENSGFTYTDSALEFIYGLTNPATDWLGLALYEEIKAGDREFELESKLIAQKYFGPLVLVYNATLEATWEGRRLEESGGEFAETLGVSYEISPRFLVGAELLHEIDLPDWSQAGDDIVFGGPNVSYRFGPWWATVATLAQLTRVHDEPDLQIRTIFGYAF
jgi:hypothetical protein